MLKQRLQRLNWPAVRDLSNLLLDVRWHALLISKNLGLVGWVGIALLAVAIAIEMLQIPRERSAETQLKRDLAALQIVSAHQQYRTPSIAPVDLLRAQLEPQDHFALMVQDINEIFQAGHVSLVEASFGDTTFKETAEIGRIPITITARGNYVAIKSVIGALMQRHPGITLEQLSLERSDPSGTVLDAKFGLVFFFRR